MKHLKHMEMKRTEQIVYVEVKFKMIDRGLQVKELAPGTPSSIKVGKIMQCRISCLGILSNFEMALC